MGEHIPTKERVKLLREFCEVNNRLPRPHNSTYENRLYNFMTKYRNFNSSVHEVYLFYRSRQPFEVIFKEFKSFCLNNDRLPKNTLSDEIELKLNRFMHKNKNKAEMRSFMNNYKLIKYVKADTSI